ncbi:Lipoma-preferred partner -like protein, partial [Takifugu flavidus]
PPVLCPPTGRCASCGDNVVGEGTGCTAMDQVFHVDCFVCMTCSTKLRGKPFFAVEKKAYCEPCYIRAVFVQAGREPLMLECTTMFWCTT